MRIVQWNPWRELDELGRQSRRLARAAAPAAAAPLEGEWLPPVDITETEKAYQIDVELPAVAPEDVEVSVKDGVLTVSGERRPPAEPEAGKQHRNERRWGRFSRSFRLPEHVDEQSIEARARDGVLYLTVAKKLKAQPRKIEVH